MVIHKRMDAVTGSLYKKEQFKNEHSAAIAPGVMLLDVLKTIENEARRRSLLPTVSHFPFHPLWFQAENERNVFLWREGFSIIQKDEFEFWIDIPKLIGKRKEALKNSSYNHPLSNSSWPKLNDGATNIDLEERYLTELEELFDSISHQATALCEASSRAIRELCPHEPERVTVVLPYARKK